MLSKHVEHNKCPFLIQNVFVDLSISFLQIRHLNIGDILIWSIFLIVHKDILKSIKKGLQLASLFVCKKFFSLDLRLRN